MSTSSERVLTVTRHDWFELAKVAGTIDALIAFLALIAFACGGAH
jgi:hypothetical protein